MSSPGSMGDRVVISLTFDANYLAPASAVIRSCLVHNRGPSLQFEIIHDETLSRHDRQKLEAMCGEAGAEINLRLMDERRLRGLPTVDRFGSIVSSISRVYVRSKSPRASLRSR